MPSLRNCIQSIPATECFLSFFSPPPSFFFVELFENAAANIFQVGTKAETAG